MSTPSLFGTDGIRGAFGEYPLDEDTVRRLAMALAADLGQRRSSPRVVIGGDTRDSTPVLCRWLNEELAARRVAVTYLGVVPTPAVAVVVKQLGADAGIAVSASHNPHPDNGIKLIDRDGFKWMPAAELSIEVRLRSSEEPRIDGGERPDADPLEPDAGAVASYLESLAATLTGDRPLAGLRVALDAGNGAAAPHVGGLFEELGAEVTLRGDQPDGRNINRGCGSTHPDLVAELTRETGSHLGFAFDGDADRVIVADESGEVRDGDAILYLWARDLARRELLPGHRIVATSMSNLGLEEALGRHGITVVRCEVGDRAVVRTMRGEGIVLGGEQSGHIIHLDLGTQGDGLLTALHLARMVQDSEVPLSEMLDGFERYPQLIENVRVRSKPDLETLPAVVAARDAMVRRLGSSGRLVLRYSGTEPLARIMIEGRDRDEIEVLAGDLAAVIAEELG